MEKLERKYSYGLIILFGLLFYVPFLGGVHLFDWDEINFAESAREMILTGNYIDVQINFQPFWEKPPLFIWIQVVSMKIFGINEFAARLPNAFCGIMSLIVLFNTGRRFRNEKFAWLWILSYAASVLPFFYFKSGIIDPWFNLFIFTGIVYFIYYLTYKSDRSKNLSLSAFFTGLAILTKGPVALLILLISLAIFLLLRKFRINTSVRDVLLFSFIVAITGGFWFILQIVKGNFQIIQDFITYQIRLFKTRDAGHGGFFLYHFVVLLAGVFPASVFAIHGFKGNETTKEGNSEFRLWMIILFWTVLILFSVVRTKIVHYSSLCYFPLTFFSAITLYRCLYKNRKMPLVTKWLTLIVATIYGIVITAIPFFDKFKSFIIRKDIIRDQFVLGNLMAEPNWKGFEPIIGIFFIILAWIFIQKAKVSVKNSIYGIFISSMIFIYLTIIFITPRIEEYSQGAAIEFYQSIKDENVYVNTIGFKSYAHLYYAKVKPGTNLQSAKNQEWFLKGDIDKPAYFVFKINRKERYLKEYPELKVLYEKNGFVFARREINN